MTRNPDGDRYRRTAVGGAQPPTALVDRAAVHIQRGGGVRKVTRARC